MAEFASKQGSSKSASPSGRVDGASDTIREAAQAGVQTPATGLPYAKQIQRSFGRHDVGRIQAHLGPKATESAEAMNASGYATKGHVVFAGTPSLHTAAHEATHVLQQRAGVQLSGGMGQAGDLHEQHADRVADLVVQGQSAEGLINKYAASPNPVEGAHSSPVTGDAPIQRKVKLYGGTVLTAKSKAVDIQAFLDTQAVVDRQRKARFQKLVDAEQTYDVEEALVQKVLTTRYWSEYMGDSERVQNDPKKRSGLIRQDEHGGERLGAWLHEPVFSKEQTGGTKQFQLLRQLIQDLEGLQKTLDKVGQDGKLEDLLAKQLPAFFLYMAHNSSHAPAQGLAKVQRHEVENPLFYFRSQSNTGHPHEKFYFSLLEYLDESIISKVPTKEKKGRDLANIPKKSDRILPSNMQMKNLVTNTFSSGLDVYDTTKFNPKDLKGHDAYYAKTSGYSGESAGKVGMRKNNAQVYSDALLTVFRSCTSTAEALGVLVGFIKQHYDDHIPEGKSLDPPPMDVGKEIQSLFQGLEAMEKSTKESESASDSGPRESIFDKSLGYRAGFAAALANSLGTASFNHFKVFSVGDNPNLVIDLGKAPLTSDTYEVGKFYHTEGWVNVVLGFLAGLLNHFSAQNRLPVYVSRRQSFGFLRPTLTDTATSIRLSLGAQPVAYARVIIEALAHLDAAISSLDPEVAKHALIIVEKKGKEGDRLTRFMRSDFKKLLSLDAAEDFAMKGAAGFTPYVQWIGKNDEEMNDPLNRVDEKSRLTDPMPNKAEDILKLTHIANKQTELILAEFTAEVKKHPTLKVDLVGDILRGVLDLATRTLKEQVGFDPMLPRSYSWVITRLINNVQKGTYLLSQAPHKTDQDEAHYFSKAGIVIEDLLEHLIALRATPGNDRSLASGQDSAEEKMKTTLIKRFSLKDSDVHVHRTDSGEQAGAASIFAAVQEYIRLKATAESKAPKKIGKQFQVKVPGKEPYFEFADLLSQSALTKGHKVGRTVDIHPYRTTSDKSGHIGDDNRLVGNLTDVSKARVVDKSEPYTLVVDITNADIDSAKVAEGVQTWIELRKTDPNLRLVLFASLLKNEQLGLDKFQAGRIIVFGQDLPSLSALSKASHHPLVNDYLSMMGQLHGNPATRGSTMSSQGTGMQLDLEDETDEHDEHEHDVKEGHDPSLTVGNFTQYDVGKGEAACGAIAPFAMGILLEYGELKKDDIHKAVVGGKDAYLEVHQAQMKFHRESGGPKPLPFMSTAEAIGHEAGPEMFGVKMLRQGGFGLKQLAIALRDLTKDDNTAVALSGPGFTFAVYNKGGQFGLFDSHGVKGRIKGAFVKTFGSIEELLTFVHQLFVLQETPGEAQIGFVLMGPHLRKGKKKPSLAETKLPVDTMFDDEEMRLERKNQKRKRVAGTDLLEEHDGIDGLSESRELKPMVDEMGENRETTLPDETTAEAILETMLEDEKLEIATVIEAAGTNDVFELIKFLTGGRGPKDRKTTPL